VRSPARRAVLSAATAVGASALLAACSSSSKPKASASASAKASKSATGSPSASPSTSASASPSATASVPPKVTVKTVADLASIKVTGAANAQPTLTYPTPLVATTTVATALITGTGPKVTSGQEVTIDYTGYVGNTGKLFQSSYTTKTTFTFVATTAHVIPGFVKSVVGFPVGSRVLIAIDPTDGYGKTAQQGIPANSTLLFVVDIHAAQTRLAHAEGAAVAPKAGLPAVTVVKDIPTAIAKPTGTPPTALTIEPLIAGTGAVLKKGDPAVFQYLLSLWTTDSRDGTAISSSWTAGTPASVPALGASATGSASALIPGLDTALTGQKVGSRILVVIPPALGYPKGNGPIKSTDTTVWCLDIIDNLIPTGG
jgi:peptidylprolyl isomerase